MSEDFKGMEELFTDVFGEDTEADEETGKLAEDIKESFEELVNTYYEENSDNDLAAILLDDEYLTEELIDKLAMINLIEQPSDDEVSDEIIEGAYISFLDTFFEMSKTLNPLGGFDKDRLTSALEILRNFEERYWPLSTRITADNIDSFSMLIPEDKRDDILVGRMRALGALRHVGEEVVAAGVICYSIEMDASEELPIIRIEYIRVHRDLRKQGIGNYLMAEVLGLALQNEGTVVTVDLPVKTYEGAEETVQGEILSNFLDSWRFQFNMVMGRSFTLLLEYVRDNEIIDRKSSESISLGDIGDKGPRLLAEYFARKGNDYDADIAALPFDFFDPEVSCVVMTGRKIRSVFLVHRYDSGNYHYEALRCDDRHAKDDLTDLLRFAYKTVIKKGDEGKKITGDFDSMEGRDLIAELIPDIHVPMVFSGILTPPESEVTSEMWDELRTEAGLSDDKLPGDEESNTDFTDDDLDKLKDLLTRANED